MNAQVHREERAHHHAHAVVHISVNGVKTPARLREGGLFPFLVLDLCRVTALFSLTGKTQAGSMGFQGMYRIIILVRLREAHER